MLLRSSSTPMLTSLLSSSSTPHFPESPNQILEKASSLPSCHLSCHLNSSDKTPPSTTFRRTRSDGNLPSLAPRPNPVLGTIASFSIYNKDSEEVVVEEDEDDDVVINNVIDNSVSFQNVSMGAKSEANTVPMFLARGLGIDRLGSGFFNVGFGGDGGGGGGCCVRTGNGGGDASDVETYYKRMVEENPSDALFLRNYAQFLYQSKGDLQRAEEYYSRAILVEPGDGEILAQYAKLVWELHHDEERACSYFEQAVRAAPDDSYVHAAYAGFLWETEADGLADGEDSKSQDYYGAAVHHGIMAWAST